MADAPRRENRTAAGVALMAFAIVVFTCIDTSAKWLSLSGLAVMQIVFARFFGHFALALALYVPREGLAAFRSNAPRRQLLRSAVLVGGTVFNFFALRHLPISITTTIAFAGPILVTLLAVPILGERVGLRRIAAVCVGFAGVAIVVQPWGAAFHPAMLYSFGMLVCASLYFIMTRMLAGIETDSAQQLWSSGVATAVLLPFGVQAWTSPEGLDQWIVLAAIGFFGVSGHIVATTAHRWADASILAPIFYTQVLWAALAGILVFGTWPTAWTLAGGAVIIGSGLYIWRRERALRVGATAATGAA